MKIGFIGLGIMGIPMARNLLKAGHPLIAYSHKNKDLTPLLNKGAQISNSYSDVAKNSDIIITMLPESQHVEDVVLGPKGVIEGIRSGSLLIDMSSISPKTSIKINNALLKKNSYALDAPVSGGPQGAENATLSIMVGGNKEAYDKALPILNVIGGKILYMGEAGSGQTTKLCNQILVGVHMQAVCEAFALAKKSGLDLVKVREAMMGGVANSKVLELHGQKIIDRTFDKPAFKLKLHRKDLAAAIETGKNLAIPLYCANITAQQMDASIAQGNAELDHTTIMLIQEQLSNI